MPYHSRDKALLSWPLIFPCSLLGPAGNQAKWPVASQLHVSPHVAREQTPERRMTSNTERPNMTIQTPFAVTAATLRRLMASVYLLGISGTTESTPLPSILLRLLFSVGLLFRPAPKNVLKRGCQGKVNSPPLTASAADDMTVSHPQRVSGTRGGSFRGVWTSPRTGARFERKRLMRMNHRLPVGTEPGP